MTSAEIRRLAAELLPERITVLVYDDPSYQCVAVRLSTPNHLILLAHYAYDCPMMQLRWDLRALHKRFVEEERRLASLHVTPTEYGIASKRIARKLRMHHAHPIARLCTDRYLRETR